MCMLPTSLPRTLKKLAWLRRKMRQADRGQLTNLKHNSIQRELHARRACSSRKRHSSSNGGMSSASPFHWAGKVLILSE